MGQAAGGILRGVVLWGGPLKDVVLLGWHQVPWGIGAVASCGVLCHGVAPCRALWGSTMPGAVPWNRVAPCRMLSHGVG